MNRTQTLVVLFLVSVFCGSELHAGDWPMWRFDAGHTATSPDELPADLQLHWSRKFSPREQTWDDTLNNDLMQYDKQFEPIVLGDKVIVGFNDSDKVACWDVKSGKEHWRFYTDGPVRMPPAGDGDRVFATSDDGFIYCLDVNSGEEIWKLRGGPSDRKVLGNRRVISMWPARGGAAVRDGQVYFASSIWPFMGTFIYSLDAETGDVTWVNDGTSATYIKQPHSAPSFAGIAPQGSFAATEDYLLIPGGRSIPAAFDRHTGEQIHFHLNAAGKGNGGTFVMANDDGYFVHTRERGVRKFELESGKKTALMLNEPVLDGDLLITSDESTVKAIKSNANGTEKETIWELPVDGSGDLIRAGDKLYAAGKDVISVIELSEDGDQKQAKLASTIKTSGVSRLVAGGDSLLAVKLDGTIECFRAGKPAELNFYKTPNDESRISDDSLAKFLKTHDADSGYAFVFGVKDADVLHTLVASSDLNVVATSQDAALVERLRREFDEKGLYGRRVSVHVGDAKSFMAPPYIARLVVVGREYSDSVEPELLDAMYRSVRPYGGLLMFASGKEEVAKQAVEAAELSSTKYIAGEMPCFKRTGSLAGSAPWTHLYGDVANTVKSNDRLVKSPLGILWFGGNTHHDVLPRHSHAPAEQVIGGRLFVEGVNSLSARDVYTGRRLWKRDFEDLGVKDIYYDDTYKDTPLSTRYNQVHIPGANARGTNFVATEHEIYLVQKDRCEVLDPATGETLRTIVLPKDVNPNGTATWTYVGVYEDMLIAGVDFAHGEEASALLKALAKVSKKASVAWSPKWFASRRIAVLDRDSGELRWHRDAKHSFIHNGMIAGGGKVFLLDKMPRSVEDQATRRGAKKPDDYQIVACDANSGSELWTTTTNVFGTWLSYSQPHDTLVHAGAAASDRSMDEVKAGMIALRGSSGEPIWENLGFEYSGPCIIHNDKVITNSRSYSKTAGVVSITDGKPIMLENPFTGLKEPWSYRRAYGCNTAVASEHLLTFRSGAAGYYDLGMKCGVANLGGFRSGCSSNLIAADGVLNAPDFTRTCSCGYQNQTSLALVHMPEVEIWTVNPFLAEEESSGKIKRMGINFGAAGTRRADDGTVWIEYPPVASEKFPLKVEVDGEDVAYTRRHSSSQDGELSWVTASHLRDFSSVTIDLGDEQTGDRFDVKLYFAEPVSSDAILVQSEPATKTKERMEEFANVLASEGKLRLDLQREDPGTQPHLAGIELKRLDDE